TATGSSLEAQEDGGIETGITENFEWRNLGRVVLEGCPSARTCVCDAGEICAPAGLKHDHVRVVVRERHAGAPDSSRKRRTRREVNCYKSVGGALVAEIAAREVGVDAFRGRLLQDAIRSVELGRIAQTFDGSPTIGDRVAEVMDDGVVNRFVK